MIALRLYHNCTRKFDPEDCENVITNIHESLKQEIVLLINVLFDGRRPCVINVDVRVCHLLRRLQIKIEHLDMTNFKDVFTSTEYRNWMKCHFAQSLAKDVLSDVVESEIESFRKQILQNAQVTPLQPSITVCNQCKTPNVIKCPTRTVCKINRSGCKFHNGVGLCYRRCPTNGICNRLCKEIIDNHRFSGPSWKNTDASQWCTSAWSIAKCYTPKDGYANVNTANDTDFNGLVNIIINCITFQKYFKDDLSKYANICTKVRDKCRELRHSPTMTMADDEMGYFIDTLVDILNNSVNVNNHYKFTETSKKLLKLKTDAMNVSSTDIRRTLQDAILNLNTMAKSLNLEDSDSLSLQQTLDVADTLHHLTGYVRTRLEHAISEEKTKTRSSNETIGRHVGDIQYLPSNLTGSFIQTSDAGTGRSTIGDGIATRAIGLGLVWLATGPVVPITIVSLYALGRFLGPVKQWITMEPTMPDENELHQIKVLQEATMTLRKELKQLFDQRQIKPLENKSIHADSV